MPSMSKPLMCSAALGVAVAGGRAFTLTAGGAPRLRAQHSIGAQGAQQTGNPASSQPTAVAALACGAALAGAVAAAGKGRAGRTSRRFFTKSKEELEADKQAAEEEAEAKRYQEFCDARDKLNLPAAVPFLGAPAYREFMFNVPGDSGFDPLNLCSDPATFEYQRAAELKHGRLAMLAAAGWPLQEIFHPVFAKDLGMKSQLAENGRSPSLLNGGLNIFGDDGVTVMGAFFTVVAFITFLVETREGEDKDKGFDLLGAENLSPPGLSALLPEGRKWMAEAEIKNGRIAMLAITAYVVEELVTRMPVVKDTPYLFSSPF